MQRYVFPSSGLKPMMGAAIVAVIALAVLLLPTIPILAQDGQMPPDTNVKITYNDRGRISDLWAADGWNVRTLSGEWVSIGFPTRVRDVKIWVVSDPQPFVLEYTMKPRSVNLDENERTTSWTANGSARNLKVLMLDEKPTLIADPDKHIVLPPAQRTVDVCFKLRSVQWAGGTYLETRGGLRQVDQHPLLTRPYYGPGVMISSGIPSFIPDPTNLAPCVTLGPNPSDRDYDVQWDWAGPEGSAFLATAIQYARIDRASMPEVKSGSDGYAVFGSGVNVKIWPMRGQISHWEHRSKKTAGGADFGPWQKSNGLTAYDQWGNVPLPGVVGINTEHVVQLKAVTDLGEESSVKEFKVLPLSSNPIPVVTSSTTLNLAEGEQGSYTLTYPMKPRHPVIIDTVSSDPTVITTSGQVTFHADNWTVPQKVTVTAARDNNGNPHQVTVSNNSQTPRVQAAAVTVNVSDTDLELDIKPQTLTLNEGGSGSYTVALKQQPDATVTLSPVNPAESNVSAIGNLTFTRENWATPQQVTVTTTVDSRTDDGSAVITYRNGERRVFGSLTVSVVNTTPIFSLYSDRTNHGRETTEIQLNILSDRNIPRGAKIPVNILLGGAILSSDVEGSLVQTRTATFNGERRGIVRIPLTKNNDNDISRTFHAQLKPGTGYAVDHGAHTTTSGIITIQHRPFPGPPALNVQFPEGQVDLSWSREYDSRHLVYKLAESTLTDAGGTSYWNSFIHETGETRTSSTNNPDTNCDNGPPLPLTQTGVSLNKADHFHGREVTYRISICPNGRQDSTTVSGRINNPSKPIVTFVGEPKPASDFSAGETHTYQVGLHTDLKEVTDTGGRTTTVLLTSSDENVATVSPSTLTFRSGRVDPQAVAVKGIGAGTATISYQVKLQTGSRGATWTDTAQTTVKVYSPKTVAQPTGLTATPGNGRVTLAWEPDANPTIRRYEYRKFSLIQALSNEVPAWENIPDSTTGTRKHVVTDLTNGLLYRFDIRAVGPSDPSPASQQVVATPMADGVITPSGTLSLSEGNSVRYSLQLSVAPSGTVAVTPRSNRENSVLPMGSLIFGPDNWNVPQSVTLYAPDDHLNRGAVSAEITHYAHGAGYAQPTKVGDTVTVSVTDNDVNTLLTTHSMINVAEDGNVSYLLRLSKRPTGNVTVSWSVSESNAVDVHAGDSGKTRSLTFTPANWDVYQRIQVDGKQLTDGNAFRIVSVTHRASGGGYETAPAKKVLLQVQDVNPQ